MKQLLSNKFILFSVSIAAVIIYLLSLKKIEISISSLYALLRFNFNKDCLVVQWSGDNPNSLAGEGFQSSHSSLDEPIYCCVQVQLSIRLQHSISSAQSHSISHEIDLNLQVYH